MNIAIPESIRKIIGSRVFSANTIGMSSMQVLCSSDMVLKIETKGEESVHARTMMTWLTGKLPVPEILAYESVDGTDYLLMSRMKGEMLCAPAFLENPPHLMELLVRGLRMLWQTDISDCPCDCSLDCKLRLAEYRVENNLCDTDNVEPGTYGAGGFASPARLLAWLQNHKPPEEPVLSHGDYCLPNIFSDAGRTIGFIDLGRAGTADRYQDIALCWRSLTNNYGGKYGGKFYADFNAQMFFDALGIQPDWERIRYYVLLDELF